MTDVTVTDTRVSLIIEDGKVSQPGPYAQLSQRLRAQQAGEPCLWCSRPLGEISWTHRGKTHTYVRCDTYFECNPAMRRAVTNQLKKVHRRRKRDARIQHAACPVCSGPLHAADSTKARTDRSTCSAACRQKLYRQRKAIEESGRTR